MKLKMLRDTFIITSLKAMPDLKRQPLIMLLVALISSLPLFFIVVLGGNISLGLIGAMVSATSFIGMQAPIQEIAFDRYVKIREMIVAMPVHPLSYAIGIALAPLILSLPSLVFFGAMAFYVGGLTLTSIIPAIVAIVLCWASVSSIGFLISTYLLKASPYALNSMSNILGILLGFIPPVYYAEEVLGSFSWIAMIFPTSNATSLIRVYSGTLSLPFEIVAIRWAILAATTIASAAITVSKARWREP